jgi:hydrogenase maturation factor HypE
MGRKTKSRRVTLSRRKKMRNVKGKFRETDKSSVKKKYTKKVAKSTKKIRKTKPKVDRSKKKGFIKIMREKAKLWRVLDE